MVMVASSPKSRKTKNGPTLPSQVCHEVERDVEGEGRKHLGREVTYDGRDGFGKGVIESVSSLFLYYRALGIQGKRSNAREHGLGWIPAFDGGFLSYGLRERS